MAAVQHCMQAAETIKREIGTKQVAEIDTMLQTQHSAQKVSAHEEMYGLECRKDVTKVISASRAHTKPNCHTALVISEQSVRSREWDNFGRKPGNGQRTVAS